jgi:hypothetical protein
MKSKETILAYSAECGGDRQNAGSIEKEARSKDLEGREKAFDGMHAVEKMQSFYVPGLNY